MSMLFRHVAWPWAVFGAAAIAAACAPDETPAGTKVFHGTPGHVSLCSSNTNPDGTTGAGQEGEVFGSIFESGLRECDNGYKISLVSSPEFSSGRIDTLHTDAGYRIEWEFWTIGLNDPSRCSVNASPKTEVHPGFGSGDEGHCVRPGVFTFTGPGRSGPRTFQVDYLRARVDSAIIDSTAGTSDLLATIDSANADLDLIINTDIGDSVYTEADTLDVDVTSTKGRLWFKDQASPAGLGTDWFRFSVRRSTSSWNATDDAHMLDRGRALARLYEREGTSGAWTPLTNYYDFRSSANVLRAVQGSTFGAPSCPGGSPISYQVGVELLRPDENPANAPDLSSLRTISVTCPAAIASVTDSLSVTNVDVGGTVQANAYAWDSGSGSVSLTGHTVAWSSLNTGVATVNSSTGVVTGVASGTATIRVTVDGTFTGDVTVTVPAVASVTLTLASTLDSGTTTQGTAVMKDAGGQVQTCV